MSLSANTVWEVRYAGSDTNGGGFVSGASGTDFSQQNSANSGGSNGSTTDAVTNGTTTITSATASFTSAIVGNIIYIAGGTGSIVGAWYQVVTYTNATTIVVDRSTGLTTGTGATMNIGGALGSPGQVGGLLVAGNQCWIKYTSGSPFVTSSASINVSGGIVGVAVAVVMQGYDLARGDRTGNQPMLQWGASAPGSAAYLFNVTGQGPTFINLCANANSVNYVGGFTSGGQYARFLWCTAENANGTSAGYGFNLATQIDATAISCYALSCLTGYYLGICQLCVASGCATYGFNTAGPLTECIAYDCGTGYRGAYSGAVYLRCVADGCTTGFLALSTNEWSMIDCVITNNTTGITHNNDYLTTVNLALYNNTANFSGTAASSVGGTVTPNITLTVSPYAGGGGSYQPNATAGGGALLRGVATAVWGQTDDKDVGAVHSANQVGLTGLIMTVRGQTVAIH